MSFLGELVRWNPPRQEVQRAYNPDFQSWVDSFLNFQGSLYQPSVTTTYAGQKAEPVADTFQGYLSGAYKANGVIFAVSMARARLFTEARFKWRRYGQTGGGSDLFGNRDLQPLERPWPGGTTQSLLMRAEQDVTCGGTFFLAGSEDGQRLLRRRPDWMEFILTAPPDEAVESDIVGYKYTVGGPRSGGRSKLYLLDECVHWAPIPDPEAQYRGMSWLTPIITEMQADTAATRHKLKFFENAATPNLTVTAPPQLTPDQFAEFTRLANEASVGIEMAYKTMYLGGGATAQVVGSTIQQMDFKTTQGAGETRIAAAGGVPPIIVGLSEGLGAATYSNYAQARRAFGDTWGSNQWRSFCGAIAPLVNEPEDAELWYDTRDIPFLREDQKDLAEIQSTQAGTVNALLAAGWTPESALTAVLSEDFSLLVHSGLMSVQLQAPAPATDESTPAELSTDATTVNALLTAGFETQSVVAAVLAGDLSLLEVAPLELEEVPAEEEDEEAARHLPGRHDQGKHGNRFKTPGDRASGLLREGKARTPRVKPEPEPVPEVTTEPVQAPEPTTTGRPLSPAAAEILAEIGPGSVLQHKKRDWIVVTVEEVGEKSTRMTNGTTEQNRSLGSYRIVKPEAEKTPVDRAEGSARMFMQKQPAGAWVGLEKLRESLADEGFNYDQQDEAMMRLYADDEYMFYAEANQKTLTPERRESALSIGNQDKHFIRRKAKK